MYTIIVYDIGVERVNKVCKFLRRYLHWIQNSVFEGELTESQLREVKAQIKKRVDESIDSIWIFIVSSPKMVQKELIGIKKAETSNII
ncbi:CRISPR-associated endonuclease Cas2 [archaeon]|nr:CRISPR-associated endonuclease Cas2 [Nanoarchaeota archaeon]MBU4451459.1 CRISPR-associated endonuclease Cas2 [Nanoarchaeota archaeon]MCG2724294.1 CRISPR-associated endonuclease Cas2 [archaeon]